MLSDDGREQNVNQLLFVDDTALVADSRDVNLFIMARGKQSLALSPLCSPQNLNVTPNITAFELLIQHNHVLYIKICRIIWCTKETFIK